HWARGSDSRGHGDSQARRQGRDTMTQRSVRTEVLIFFWAGNRAPFIFFGYVSTKEPVAQLVARVTVSLISVEAISTTLKGCLETLWPTDSSLDLAYFLSKLCVECGEPLSSTVEKKATPQTYGLKCFDRCRNNGLHTLWSTETLSCTWGWPDDILVSLESTLHL
ncbi:unnamed protein product, partial [Penicillium nalgiovense]